MPDPKTFPTEIVLSLTTGVLLKAGGFGDMHELAEHVRGSSIWTHEFADKALWRELSEAVFAQHPQLREAEEFERGDAAIEVYLPEYVARAIARFGESLSIAKGATGRTESPIASLQRIRGANA